MESITPSVWTKDPHGGEYRVDKGLAHAKVMTLWSSRAMAE